MRRDERLAVGIPALLVLLLAALYLLPGLTPRNAAYYLSRRGPQLVAVMLAAGSAGAASIVFQSITRNRLLTPSVMGIESLYVLMQTGAVFFLGGTAGTLARPLPTYLATLVVMVVFAALLLGGLMSANLQVNQVLLVGVVMGILFRSLTGFLQMIIDPNEFSVVQGNTYASVTNVSSSVIPAASIVGLGTFIWIGTKARILDVIALGREPAIALGIDYRRETRNLLTVAAVAVASGTAMVGPLPFLGLLAAGTVREASSTWRHRSMIPSAALTAIVYLLGIQTIRRTVGTPVPVGTILALAGGLFFLAIAIRSSTR